METAGQTDWLSAIAMLLSGLIVAFMFIYASMRKKQQAAASPASDLELRDLEARRDTLIQQLRELDDVPANAAERTRLEREAAQVLRKLDGVGQAPSPVRPHVAPKTGEAPVLHSPNAALKGFLWGVGSVLILGFLGWFVYRSSTEKSEPQQQPPMAAQPQTQTQPAQTDPAVQQLEAAVNAQPDDIDARINLTRAYFDRQNMMGVFQQTQAVLQKSPNEPRALTYQALVRMAMGQQDVAGKMLQQAVKTDPKLLDAYVGIAWLDFQTGKPDEGEKAIRDAIKQHPEQTQHLNQILAELKSHKAEPQQPAVPPNHPTLPEPGAEAGDAVHLTLNVDPSARGRVPQNAVIFLIARPQGVTAGPPVAVKRLTAASFPLQVDFSSADSMMGQPLPAKFHLEARIDSDGDPLTKSPTDPIAVDDAVATGSTLTLTLK
jgi:cytochrome c-type biogenesis protein CcmH